jgi:hypothetical protein
LRIPDCGLKGKTVRRGATSSPPSAAGRAVAHHGESSTFGSPLDVGSRSLSLFNPQFAIRNPQFLRLPAKLCAGKPFAVNPQFAIRNSFGSPLNFAQVSLSPSIRNPQFAIRNSFGSPLNFAQLCLSLFNPQSANRNSFIPSFPSSRCPG